MNVIVDWCCGEPCKKEVVQAVARLTESGYAQAREGNTLQKLVRGFNEITDSPETEHSKAKGVDAVTETRWSALGIASCTAVALTVMLVSVYKRKQRDPDQYVSLESLDH